MTASSTVVLGNLAYLIGAVVLAIIGGTIVWLRHRKPKSVDANVESFNRGLRALAPEGSNGSRPRKVQPLGWHLANPPGFPPPPASDADVEEETASVESESSPAPEVAEPVPVEQQREQAAAVSADEKPIGHDLDEGVAHLSAGTVESSVIDLSRDDPAEAKAAGTEEDAGSRAGAEAG